MLLRAEPRRTVLVRGAAGGQQGTRQGLSHHALQRVKTTAVLGPKGRRGQSSPHLYALAPSSPGHRARRAAPSPHPEVPDQTLSRAPCCTSLPPAH